MSDANITESDVREALSDVIDPEIGRGLDDLRMLKQITMSDDGRIHVEIELPTPAYPERERITNRIEDAIDNRFSKRDSVDVRYSWLVRGNESGRRFGLKVKNVIAVGSGKGGVGKSTVSAALAIGLKELGAKVGLMDADVYGPSIPHLLGAQGHPGVIEQPADDGQPVTRIVPIEHDGLKVLSIGFMINEDQAVIWRGPMLNSLLTQFLQETDWGELDYLVIDLPPGTGDVAISLSQMLDLSGAVVVCTPQKVALLDAIKAVAMFRQVDVPVCGIVENITGAIFGRGGAKQKAQELGVPFLGEIPSEPEIRIQGDEGNMAGLFAADGPARPYLMAVCQSIAMQLAKQHLAAPRLPKLDIL